MFDLLQFMQQDGYISAHELSALRQTTRELGENPVRLLRSLNIASPEQIQIFLQKHFKVLILKEEALANLNPDYQIFLPIDIALFYSCFGIGEENDVIYIAMEDPSDRGIINQIRFLIEKKVVGVSATVFQLAEGLTKIYGLNISNLKLTTSIEKSRGVVGGVRYHEHHENTIEINDDFSGIGLVDEYGEDEKEEQNSLAVNEKKEVLEEKSTQTKKPPPPEPDLPTFNFIDGSSGTIDPKLLEDDKQPLEDEIIGIDNSIENTLLSEEKPSDSLENEIVDNIKISAIINQALTKIAFTKTKEQAFDILNNLLQPFNISILLTEENSFQLKTGSILLKENLNILNDHKHQIYNLLLPVLRKIAKLK